MTPTPKRIHPGAPRAVLPGLALVLGTLVGCAAPSPDPSAGPATPPPADTFPYVVMISFDGMRYDFMDRVPTPSFDRVAEMGVRATGLIPGYPTKTFPNHYGMATGLYPAHHGLVDNSFYDPVFDASYRIGDRDAVRDGRWYLGEPIWVTAEQQGVRTASFFWVGTEAPIQGVQPTYFKYYDQSVTFPARVDTVLSWLSLPRPERPRLVLLYFHEPDGVAHDRGPDHPAVDSMVRELDGHLGRLLDGLEALPIADQIHVMLVSDHGMAPVPAEHVIHLEDHADLEGVRAVYNSTQALLYFDGDTARVDEVYGSLTDSLPHATVYRKGETPVRWHYDGNRRIGELVVAAEPGWILRPRDWRPWRGGGMHGWDPYHRPMHGIFLAAGPRIAAGPPIAAFENVHIYPFLARLLGLRPADGIDGELEILAPILHEDTRP